MEPKSHSCPRCEWLVLGSRTGHSPFPDENKRIDDEDERRFIKFYGTVYGPPAQEVSTSLFWRYPDVDIEWDFDWPTGYKACHGDCELLKAFLLCFRNQIDMDDSKVTTDCHLRGYVLREDYDGEKGAILFVKLLTAGEMISSQTSEDDSYPTIHLEMFLPIDGGCKQWFDTRAINLRPESDTAFNLIKSWIHACEIDHVQFPRQTEISRGLPQGSITYCSSDSSYVPDRLLHVDFTNLGWEISLIDSKRSLPNVVPYLALSYCWGGDQSFKTTKESIKESPTVIDYTRLPRTIQDACRTTLKLGYSYLWVDALCIAQDDEDEMQREIANMKHIYSNAVLTIAASRASSSDEGFLQKREPTRIFPLKIRSINADETVGELGVMDCLMSWFSQDIQPLDRRAWALQESLLSSRMLEFTSVVTRFYCATSCKQERNLVCFKHVGYRGYRGEGDRSQISNILPTEFAHLDSAKEYWWRVVQMYTSRGLSVPTDRPLAISGLAERFHQQMSHLGAVDAHNTYVAGHWGIDLPESLDWYVDGRVWAYPKEHQGPSWSWQSVSGTIRRLSDGFRMYDSEQKVLIQLCDYEVSLADPNAYFGAVTWATLTVRCYISLVTLKDERQTDKRDALDQDHGVQTSIYAARGRDARDEHGINWTHTVTRFDTTREFLQDWNSRKVFLAQIRTNTHPSESIDTIMLQYADTVNGTRRFRRIGCSVIYYMHPYNKHKMPTWAWGWDLEVIQFI